MKVLIWIGCLFVATVLNTLLGYLTGFKLGVLIFYPVTFFVARKLCMVWEDHRDNYYVSKHKEARDAQRICPNCGQMIPPITRVCPNCGTLSKEG